MVNHRHQVNYLKALARQNGQKLKQQKQADGVFMVWCIGHMKTSALPARLNALNLQRETKRRWREQNRQRYECQLLTRKFIRNGVLARQPCEVCGSARSYAFHRDYAKPAEVVWLCRQHLLEMNGKTLSECTPPG